MFYLHDDHNPGCSNIGDDIAAIVLHTQEKRQEPTQREVNIGYRVLIMLQRLVLFGIIKTRGTPLWVKP